VYDRIAADTVKTLFSSDSASVSPGHDNEHGQVQALFASLGLERVCAPHHTSPGKSLSCQTLKSRDSRLSCVLDIRYSVGCIVGLFFVDNVSCASRGLSDNVPRSGH